MATSNRISALLSSNQQQLIDAWIVELLKPGVGRHDLITEEALRRQATEFIRLLRKSSASSDATIDGPAWQDLKHMLEELSRSRADQGFSSSETASFIFSFKQPLFDAIGSQNSPDSGDAASLLISASNLLDQLGLYTTEVYVRSREDVIRRQQDDMLELSTPVVKLWNGVLALPIIGTLDSARTQVAMENLLQAIVDAGAEVAIIDITGVPTVDTLTSQHLLKTVAAARLMGAECIISGIRPQIAQTIVHLGVDLSDVVTKATLADAFVIALRKLGLSVCKSQKASAGG